MKLRNVKIKLTHQTMRSHRKATTKTNKKINQCLHIKIMKLSSSSHYIKWFKSLKLKRANKWLMVKKFNSSVGSTVEAATTTIIIEGSGVVVAIMYPEVSGAATAETVTIVDSVPHTEATMSNEVVTTKPVVKVKAAGAITIATSSNRRNKTTSKLYKTQVNRTTITEGTTEAEVITNHGVATNNEVSTNHVVITNLEVTTNVAITTIGDAATLQQPLVKMASLNSRDTLIIEAVPITSLQLIGVVVVALTARKRSVQGLRSMNKPTTITHLPRSEACNCY